MLLGGIGFLMPQKEKCSGRLYSVHIEFVLYELCCLHLQKAEE